MRLLTQSEAITAYDANLRSLMWSLRMKSRGRLLLRDKPLVEIQQVRDTYPYFSGRYARDH